MAAGDFTPNRDHAQRESLRVSPPSHRVAVLTLVCSDYSVFILAKGNSLGISYVVPSSDFLSLLTPIFLDVARYRVSHDGK